MSTVAKPKAQAIADTKSSNPGRARDDLLKRAADGDQSCLGEVRALFDGDQGRHLVEWYGSPAVWFRESFIAKATGDHVAMREATERTFNKVRSDLEGPNPTPLERLLAERAALCWLAVNCYESTFALAKDLSIKQAEFHQRKIDRAHARFLSAVRTLAQIRKLALPNLQLNIARNQVNVVETRS